MARSRNIKPGFFTNDILCELNPLARLLFSGIWTLADREGRLEDRPKKIKAEVLPYDTVDADSLLGSLETAGFILRYKVNDIAYIQVVNWCKHQNPHIKEGASTIPAPCESGASTMQAPCDTPPKPEQAGLIPDSGFLIPDSLHTSPAELTKCRTGNVSTVVHSKPERLPPCPHQAIIDAYHTVLPELPRVKLLPEKRKTAIAKVWGFALTSKKNDGSRRATTAEEALQWFGEYFERARANDFVMGRGQRSLGHENWESDLDYLLSDKGLKQVIEKTRDRA